MSSEKYPGAENIAYIQLSGNGGNYGLAIFYGGSLKGVNHFHPFKTQESLSGFITKFFAGTGVKLENKPFDKDLLKKLEEIIAI